MRKLIITIISLILVFVLSFYIGTRFNKNKSNEINYENRKIELEEETKTAISEEEKIGPNAILILKTHYNKCLHEEKLKKENIKELVNLNEQELKEKYSEWNIEKFSSNEIILTKNEEGYCNEHFILREEEGYIVVYFWDKNEEEQLYQETNIATEYLPETDKGALKNGIKVYSTESLTEILQDFE